MTNLTARLKRLAEFDEDAMLAQYNTFGVDAMAWGELAGFAAGARWERARLQPLLTALIECAEQLSIMVEHNCVEFGLESGVDFEPGDSSAIGDATAALSRLEQLCVEVGE